MSITNSITQYKLIIANILTDYIGLLKFPDGNTTKALIELPDNKYGMEYPPSGTTLQDGKIGVALTIPNQPILTGLSHNDYTIRVSAYTNRDISLLLEVWDIVSKSILPIIGEPELKKANIDPVAKNFLFFSILTSL